MKVQTALRFDKELLDRVREKAQAQKRSLNNYIEYLLYKEVGDIPNVETEEAIREAKTSQSLKPIKDLEKFLDSI